MNKLVLALFAVWMCVGIFPLYCYESDSMVVTAGCEIMYNQGWTLPPVYTYEYDMQPLVTVVVVALKHVVPFLTCEQIYCLLSAACAFAFLLGCISFATRILPSARSSVLWAAFLLPEMAAIAMYPNSAIPAAALFVGALLAITRHRQWLTLALLCVAPLFRIDVLIVYPAVLPLFYLQGLSLWKSLLRSAGYALAVVAFLVVAFWLLHANPLKSFEGYNDWNDITNPTMVKVAILGFYSVVYFALLPLGLAALWKERQYKVILLVIIPIATLHFVYRSMGCASKHYVYLAPFVIICGAEAVEAVKRFMRRRPLRQLAVWTVLGAYLCGSVYADLTSKPWRSREGAYSNIGPRLPLLTFQAGGNTLHAGLGAGQILPTEDELMLASGHLLYPLFINQVKRQYVADIAAAKKRLGQEGDYDLLTYCWQDYINYPLTLLADGYRYTRLEDPVYNYELRRGKHRIRVRRNGWEGSVEADRRKIMDDIERFTAVSASEPRVYFCAFSDRYVYQFEEIAKTTGKLQKVTTNLYVITPKQPATK